MRNRTGWRDWLMVAASVAAILSLAVALLAWLAPFGGGGPSFFSRREEATEPMRGEVAEPILTTFPTTSSPSRLSEK